MKTVAIICEYNPFHSGHYYQIQKILHDFGKNTRIVSIMSGNFTQRGEIAFCDKFIRAEAAVRCGVNLVIELPFPFSSSSAEFFAQSGVKIANDLGQVDYLSFGSEVGDIDILKKIAANMITDKFVEAIRDKRTYREIGYASSVSKIYNRIFQDGIDNDFFTPNNILAIEYIKALKLSKSAILPHTFKRVGASYNDNTFLQGAFQSSSAIREEYKKNNISALDFIPESAKETLLLHQDSFPCDIEKIATAIISSLRINPPSTNIHEANGGLYNRIRSASFNSETFYNLISLSDTKKYTSARIKRAVMNSFFGVTSSTVKELPLYSQLLAADKIGQEILKKVKESGKIPILTKPSSYSQLSEQAQIQKKLSDRADSIFQLTKPRFTEGNATLRATPFILK